MQLDDAYANAPYVPRAEEFPPRWAEQAALFRAELGEQAELGIAYGPSARQAYDLFCVPATKGTLIFVHGGYWLKFERARWSHLAAGAMAAGWSVWRSRWRPVGRPIGAVRAKPACRPFSISPPAVT